MVISHRLDVMRADVPHLTVIRHNRLDIVQIVVRRQVQRVARRDVIVDKLVAVFNHTEAFVWIEVLLR